MERSYRVNGLTKKGAYQHWAMDVTAKTQKEAVQKAVDCWYSAHNAHLFHVKAQSLGEHYEFLYHFWKRVHGEFEKQVRFAKCADGTICVQWATEFDDTGAWKNWRERWFEPGQEADAEKFGKEVSK